MSTRLRFVAIEGELPDRGALVDQAAPLRRCADCVHDLGEPFLAAFVCPMFGKPRAGVEIRCVSFKPRAAG